MTWRRQRPLAERWSLLVLDRRGYYPNPPIQHEDFEVDAADVAELLVRRGPAHLVGHSYGAVISLLVAARVPEHVRSLTVIEPPAFGLVPDDADVRGMVAGLLEYWEEGARGRGAGLRGCRGGAGAVMRPPRPLEEAAQERLGIARP